jgi:hypothetical protein
MASILMSGAQFVRLVMLQKRSFQLELMMTDVIAGSADGNLEH